MGSVCEKKTDSYDDVPPANEVCRVLCGTCSTSAPSMYPSNHPSVAPTSSNPTESPTASSRPSISTSTMPSLRKSANPTITTTTPISTPCCSNNFQTCLNSSPWCDKSEANCQKCGGVIITGAPLQCIPKWNECTNDHDGCCAPASCQGNKGYRQCLE